MTRLGAFVLAFAALGATAASAQSYRDDGLPFANPCRPPLKFAAGACVPRCPAGYTDAGASCTFRGGGGGGGGNGR